MQNFHSVIKTLLSKKYFKKQKDINCNAIADIVFIKMLKVRFNYHFSGYFFYKNFYQIWYHQAVNVISNIGLLVLRPSDSLT